MAIARIDWTFDKHSRTALTKKRILPALALSVAVSLTVAQKPVWASDEPMSIKKISLNDDKQIVVEFDMSADAELSPPSLEDFPGPNHRVVMDFSDAVIEKGKTQPASITLKELSKAYPDIKGIRYAALKNADKPTARVVLDLPESFQDKPEVIKVGTDSVIISLLGAGKVVSSKTQSAAPEAPPTASTPDGEITDSGRIQPGFVAPVTSSTTTTPASTSTISTAATDVSTTASKSELRTHAVYDASNDAAKVSAASDLTSPYPAATHKEGSTSPQESPSSETPASESSPTPPVNTAKQSAVRHYNDAVKLHLSGKLSAAISEYQSAIADYPNLSEAHSNLGLIYNQQHNYPQALIELRKALAINPKDAITYNGVGAALRAQKDMTGAIKNWQTAISLDPKLATAHYNLGTAYEIQKDYDKALECYRQAVKNDYRLGEAHYRMGLILQKKNNSEEALTAFNKALQASAKADYSEDVRQRIAVMEKKKVAGTSSSHE